MKHIFILFLISILASSCGVSDSFTKKKFLNLESCQPVNKNDQESTLKVNINEHNEKNDSPNCDTIKLKSGQIIFANIVDTSKGKVWFWECDENNNSKKESGWMESERMSEVEEIIYEPEKSDSIIAIESEIEQKELARFRERRGNTLIIWGSILIGSPLILYLTLYILAGTGSLNNGSIDLAIALISLILISGLLGLIFLFWGLSHKYRWFKKRK